MLNEIEKRGASDMLNLTMPQDDLIQLAKTVTNNQITAKTKQDAVQAIVTYSMSPVELLKRRKLKKEFFFQYLHNEQIVVDPKAEKFVLAKAILKHWGSTNVDMLDLLELQDGPSQTASPSSGQSHQRVPSLLEHCTVNIQNNQYIYQPIQAAQPPPRQIQQQQQQQTAPQQWPVQKPQQLQPQQHLQAQSPHGGNDIAQSPHGGNNIAAQTSAGSWIADFMNFEHSIQAAPNDEALGREFSKWFYQMLNACNPRGEPCGTEFGTQHFFTDSSLKVLVMNTNELQSFQGPESICEKLLSIVKGEQLMFNANVDVDGVRTFSTPHGLKVLIACGTLHKSGGEPVGIFAQQFGIVKNPEKNFTWNIKYTNLKLGAGQPSQQPTLDSPGNILPLQ